jgi:hypothetical protein
MIVFLILFFLLSTLVLLSLILAETAYPAVDTSIKERLLGSLRRIADAQSNIAERSDRCLLFFSLVCCMLAIGILLFFAIDLSPYLSELIETPALVTSQFAPLIFLGLFTLIQVAGEVSLALTERRQNSSAAFVFNSYFWLPLLLSWASLAAYLPTDSSHAAKSAVSSMWLGVLQPLGYVAFVMTLIGPYFLINVSHPDKVSPLQNWIRELRLMINIMITVLLLGSHTCFSTGEMEGVATGIIKGVIQLMLIPILVGIVFRMKAFFRRRDKFNAERLWKIQLWLSLIALTASFFAFHVIGKSDPLMHVLLNFSLLAIWVGFIAPKGNFNQAKILQG